MAKGGARNRSGPMLDPNSGRSDRRGISLDALPSEGFDGEPPAWPLPPSMMDEAIADRERMIWREMWRTPQACAWIGESWRWETIAEFCRLKASIELSAGANAAQVGQIHRYRDQIGLSPAGMRENGWTIAADEVGQRRSESVPAAAESVLAPKPRRLSAV